MIVVVISLGGNVKFNVFNVEKGPSRGFLDEKLKI